MNQTHNPGFPPSFAYSLYILRESIEIYVNVGIYQLHRCSHSGDGISHGCTFRVSISEALGALWEAPTSGSLGGASLPFTGTRVSSHEYSQAALLLGFPGGFRDFRIRHYPKERISVAIAEGAICRQTCPNTFPRSLGWDPYLWLTICSNGEIQLVFSRAPLSMQGATVPPMEPSQVFYAAMKILPPVTFFCLIFSASNSFPGGDCLCSGVVRSLSPSDKQGDCRDSWLGLP